MTAPTPQPDVLAVLDQLDALRAAGAGRKDYPSQPVMVQNAEYPADLEWAWSDGGHSGAAECYGEETATLILAAVNRLPELTATLRAVHALAEEWSAEADEDERWLKSPRVSVDEARELPASIREARGHVRALRTVLAALTSDTSGETP